jgi:hypothetical protein
MSELTLSEATMRREGVTASVDAKMTEVQANVLGEDGMLFRTCEHGIRHPVGHIHDDKLISMEVRQQRHHRAGATIAACDQCCLNW